MKFTDRVIIAGLKKYAKDLSDSEILSLYKKVKEKLESQNKDEDQVLDGQDSGPEPQGDENNSLIKPVEPSPAPESAPAEAPTQEAPAENDKELDSSIDQLLADLGLDGDGTEDTDTEATDTAPEQPEEEQSTQATAEVPEQPAEPAQQPKAMEEMTATIEDGEDPLVPEQAQLDDEDVIGEMFDKMEMENNDSNEDKTNEFSIEHFKIARRILATRGLQVTRKDKDMMADGITKPKYEEPDIKPPRLDCRRPNGIRWKKNEENRDSDTDSDPDLK